MTERCFTFYDNTKRTVVGDVLLRAHKPWMSAARAYMKEARLVDPGDFLEVERGAFKRVQRKDVQHS